MSHAFGVVIYSPLYTFPLPRPGWCLCVSALKGRRI